MEVRLLGPTVPFWCVDAGDDAVTALRVRRSGDDALEVLAAFTAPLRPGEDPARATAALLRGKGLRDHGIHLLLPGRGSCCRSCRIAAEDADLPAREMERELLDLTSLEAEEAILRWRRLGGPGVLDFRVVAERRAEVERWKTAFADAGFLHLGIGLSPAAVQTALEWFQAVSPRGYLLEVRGAWSILTAFEGPLSIRHPIPFGLRDLRRRLEEEGGGVTLDQALEAPPGTPAAAALAAAAAPLGQDLRRAAEFHRASISGTGDETLLPLGPSATRPGLRAVIASFSPVPLAALPSLGEMKGVRLGPRVKPELPARELAAWIAPLGGALSAAAIAPRDLDLRHLPDDLREPADHSLFPVAAALVLAAVGVSWVMASRSVDALRLGRDAVASIPEPAPPRGGLSPAKAAGEARTLLLLTEEARERAALRRALTDLVGAFPRAESGGAADGSPPGGFPPWGTEGFQVLHEGGNYRVRLRLRPAPSGGGPGAPPPRMEPLVRALEEKGWRITGSSNGVLTAEILRMRQGDDG